LERVIARDNKANRGAVALFTSSGILTVNEDCQFFGNVANATGGVFHLEQGTHATIKQARFESNSANVGGVFLLDNVIGDLRRCQFTSNKALQNGGSIALTHDANINLENSDFIGNNAVGFGGAVYQSHGAALTSYSNDFSNNTALKGGAIASDADNCILNGYDNTFEFNLAKSSGGAIFLLKAKCSSSDEQFFENQSQGDGGSFFVSGSELKMFDGSISSSAASLSGGGIYMIQQGSLLLTDTSIYSSSSHKGAALYCKDSKADLSDSDITNNQTDNNLKCEKCQFTSNDESCNCSDC